MNLSSRWPSTRLSALAALFLFWAVIYLTGLGSGEFKGEEGRRVLPAVAMLDTGNWLVPYLNGKPYERKPPLVNWAIAASMKVTAQRNEWSARLPSALAMLALGAALVWTGSRWLTPGGGFVAAIFVLCSVAFVEKGRLAEIEAIYVACTGVAMAWWLAAWVNRETGWRLWLLPGLFLGLGLLAKGPTHLLFFYGLAIPLLFAAGEKRQLWSVAHLISLALAVLIFVAWAVPYFRVMAEHNAAGVWMDQMKGRVGGGSLKWSEWLPNFPRALMNGLPWILFAPLWWNRRVLDALGARDERLRLLVRASRWPFMACFAGLMLIPGMLPRYTLPIFPAGALLLALVAPYAAPVWRTVWRNANAGLAVLVLAGVMAAPWVVGRAGFSAGGVLALAAATALLAGFLYATFRLFPQREPALPLLAAGTALCVATAMVVFTVAVAPRVALSDDLRPVGAAINAAVPQNQPLYVIDPGYEPSLFYVRRICFFVDSPKRLPAGARYVLVAGNDVKKVKSRWPAASDAAHLPSKGKKRFFLLKLSAESEKTPSPSGV